MKGFCEELLRQLLSVDLPLFRSGIFIQRCYSLRRFDPGLDFSLHKVLPQSHSRVRCEALGGLGSVKSGCAQLATVLSELAFEAGVRVDSGAYRFNLVKRLFIWLIMLFHDVGDDDCCRAGDASKTVDQD